MSLELTRPEALLLVWLTPLIPGVFFLGGHLRRRRIERLLGTPLPKPQQLYRNWSRGPVVRATLATIAFLMLVFALSRPVWGYRVRRMERLSANIVIAIDTSRSMLTADATGDRTRLEFASLKISMLLDFLRGDRVGLVAFAGEGITACPLTYDASALKVFLEALDPETVPLRGTSLGEALEAALRMLEKAPAGGKAVVLVTDGEGHNLQSPDELVRKAEEAGAVVHTLGVGSTEGSPIRVNRPDGSWEYVKNSEGAVVHSRLREETLRRLASGTKGVYAHASPGNSDVKSIAAAISRAGRAGSEEVIHRMPVERYRWPAATALLALVLLLLLPRGILTS